MTVTIDLNNEYKDLILSFSLSKKKNLLSMI